MPGLEQAMQVAPLSWAPLSPAIPAMPIINGPDSLQNHDIPASPWDALMKLLCVVGTCIFSFLTQKLVQCMGSQPRMQVVIPCLCGLG